MYYSCSENKGTDQLCSYCTADLRICFPIGKTPVFSCHSSCSWPSKILIGSLRIFVQVGYFPWTTKFAKHYLNRKCII